MARTVRGIEWIAVAEIQGTLGAPPTRIDHREVRFEPHALSPDVLALGTPDDVLAVVCELGGVGRRRQSLNLLRTRLDQCDPGALLPALRQLRRIPSRPSFDVSATFRDPRNFNRFEIEDAVGTSLAAATRWRYETRSGGRRPPPTDLSFRVPERRSRDCGDPSGSGAAAPPSVPAGVAKRVASSDRRPSSGTARWAREGLHPARPLRWRRDDPDRGALARPGLTCVGYDINPAVVELARSNARRADVDVRFEHADATALPTESGSVDRIVSNPPWGRAVLASAPLARAWCEMVRVLRSDGRVSLLGPDDLVRDAGAALPLRAALRTPVSLLGQHVAISVLSPDGRLTAPGQLLEREIDEAFECYANVVPTSAGS